MSVVVMDDVKVDEAGSNVNGKEQKVGRCERVMLSTGKIVRGEP